MALSESGHLYAIQESCCGQPTELARVHGGDLRVASTAGKMVDGAFVPDEINDSRVADFDCGRAHTLALTVDGRVVGWGLDDWLQLGQGEPIGRGLKAREAAGPGTTVRQRPLPTELHWERGESQGARGRAVTVAAGGDTSFVVVEEEGGEQQSLYSCGFGSYGTLGNGGKLHAKGFLSKVTSLSGQRCKTLALSFTPTVDVFNQS